MVCFDNLTSKCCSTTSQIANLDARSIVWDFAVLEMFKFSADRDRVVGRHLKAAARFHRVFPAGRDAKAGSRLPLHWRANIGDSRLVS